MKTKVKTILVSCPNGDGCNVIHIRAWNGDLKRHFVERLLRDNAIPPQPEVTELLREVLAENKRLRKEVLVQKMRIEIRDEIIKENGFNSK